MTAEHPVGVRPRTLATLVILGLVIAAGMAGAAVDRIIVRARSTGIVRPDTGFHPLSTILRSPTDEERRQARVKLAHDLDLTKAQALIVDSILDAHTMEFRAIREEITPRIEKLTNSVRGDIEQVLTPKQRTQYRKLLGTARETGTDTIPPGK